MMKYGTGIAAMEERIQPGSFFHHPLTGFRPSPCRPPLEPARYLAELLQEQQKFGLFLKVMPNCRRLLNQELIRVFELERYEHGGPRSLGQPTNGMLDFEENCHLLQRASQFRDPDSVSWSGMPPFHNPRIVKKSARLNVPVDKYPTFNFVGRLLGPRGNSLKRIELASKCRVFIRGRGSVKDVAYEEKQKGKPGYEHLSEPLHILIEAELPEDIINIRLKQVVNYLKKLLKPMDESIDHYKRAQLKELAALNGTLRGEIGPSPSLSPCISPFNINRANTGIN